MTRPVVLAAMRLLRPTAIAAASVSIVIALSGCGTVYFTDGLGVTSTPTPLPSPSLTLAAPTPSPTPTQELGGWVECTRIVGDLNKNAADSAAYRQVEAAKFPVQQVGAGVLRTACVIEVTSGGESTYWAVLPGNDSLAASIKASLISAGFTNGGSVGTLMNTKTDEGALVASFADGAALETFLGGPTGFARLHDPLVYVGSFFLS